MLSLAEGFEHLVGNIQRRAATAEYSQGMPEIEAAIRSIQALPADLQTLPEAAKLLETLRYVLGQCRGTAGDGRPRDTTKNQCLAFSWYWLNSKGKKTSGGKYGTVPNIASAVWEAAGRKQAGETLDSWVNRWKRIRDEQKLIREQMIKAKTPVNS
jgi:hypothetical protein